MLTARRLRSAQTLAALSSSSPGYRGRQDRCSGLGDGEIRFPLPIIELIKIEFGSLFLSGDCDYVPFQTCQILVLPSCLSMLFRRCRVACQGSYLRQRGREKYKFAGRLGWHCKGRSGRR